MHSLENQYIGTHSLNHELLLHHGSDTPVANKELPSSLMPSTQNDTQYSLPIACFPKYFNQALPCNIHHNNSTSLNSSLIDPTYTYASNSIGIDNNMRFYAAPYRVEEDDTRSNVQEASSIENSNYVKEEKLLSKPLAPHIMNATSIQETDDHRGFTSGSYAYDVLGSNSSTIQEEMNREICSIKKEDGLSSQFCRAGHFDVSTPSKQGAHNDGDIRNFSPPTSNLESGLSMESLSADPSRASLCKASKCPRKKKAHQKQVICVPIASGSNNRSPGGCLHSDSWAWRKYGQKPIKGSPYPRGYYRCSSCKGCTARKQVERSSLDPSMLLITYTSDHNHTLQEHQINQQNLKATLYENPNPVYPHKDCHSIHGSMQHDDSIHVKNLATSSPYDSLLEGNYPCIRGENHFELLYAKGPENELDYFNLVEELPCTSSLTMLESATSSLSEHDDPITIVHSNNIDPFNLFNWSSNIGINYYSPT